MTRPSADLLAFRRTQAAGVAARWALVMVVVGGAVLSMVPGKNAALGTAIMLAGAAVYVVLSYRAIQVSREALEAPERLASGDLAGAEELLTGTLRRFSIFPAQRVVQLHQLASLRRQQGRFAESIELATAALALRSPPDVRLDTQIIRLEALLDVGDLTSAHRALLALMNEPLRLLEHARLTALRIRYESTIGASHHLINDLQAKVELLDFVPTKTAADSLVRLAVAAESLGQPIMADYLRAKAVCLIPAATLAGVFPAHAEPLRTVAARLGLK